MAHFLRSLRCGDPVRLPTLRFIERQGRASGSPDGVPSGDASNEDQDHCKDDKRRGKYPNVKFDFLGYCFRLRLVRRTRDGMLFCGFNPAVSPSALKSMRAKIRELGIRRRSDWSLALG
jgi:hypothetical protein